MTNERKNVFQQASLWAKTKAFEHGMRKRMTYDEKEWRGPPMWKVPLPWEEPAFFTKSIAQEFATKWGVPIDEIEENTDVFFTPPEKMEWLRRQHAAGMNTGSVALRIIEAHPQSIGTAIDWFTGLDRANPAAAYNLLRLGFAANQADTTAAVADLFKWAPWAWFAPTKMQAPTQDPQAMRPGNESALCVFARMLPSPALLNWFFEHQPQFKQALIESNRWDELQKVMQHGALDTSEYWPLVAHHVFGMEASPLDFHRKAQASVWNLAQLQRSYAHSPAAQCSLWYHQLKTNPHYDLEMATDKVVAPQDNRKYGGIDAQVHLFYQKLAAIQQQKDPCAISSTPLVDQLMLGVYLDQSPMNFYLHAKNVYAQNADNKPPASPEEPIDLLDMFH